MNRLLASLIAWVALAASAAVTPLPGSTPQTVVLGDYFQPVSVLVTDASGTGVAGAKISWYIGFNAAVVSMDDLNRYCWPEAGYNCGAVTNDQGIAQLGRLFGASVGTQFLTVYGPDNGSTTLRLTVIPKAETARVSIVAGGGQRAVLNTSYGARFEALAVGAYGSPLLSWRVVFKVVSGSASFAESEFRQQSTAMTGFNGIAVSAPFLAGWGLGRGTVIAELYDPRGVRVFVSDPVDFTNTNVDGTTFTSFQDLWWGGPAEDGWGLAVVQHGESLFNAIFAYDAKGNPTWYVQPEGKWTEGLGSRYFGPVYSPRSSPYFAYDASRFTLGAPDFNWDLSFNGPDAGALKTSHSGYVQGVGYVYGYKRISRLEFSSETPPPMEGVGGLWWGGVDQDGWGVVVIEKHGILFSVWFTYDEAGKPIWFPMEEGRWIDSATYAGGIFRTSSSPWPLNYMASQLRAVEVGSFAFRFSDRDHMTFEYELDGHSASIPLQRL
jgi:hypothetical protein